MKKIRDGAIIEQTSQGRVSLSKNRVTQSGINFLFLNYAPYEFTCARLFYMGREPFCHIFQSIFHLKCLLHGPVIIFGSRFGTPQRVRLPSLRSHLLSARLSYFFLFIPKDLINKIDKKYHA